MKYITILFLLISSLYAHKSGLSYLNIVEKNNHIDITYKKPLNDLLVKDIKFEFDSSCYVDGAIFEKISNGFITKKFNLKCKNGLKNTKLWVNGLVRSDKGVMVIYETTNTKQKALLRSTTPYMELNYKSSSFELFLEYVKLGIEHILGGYDHLSFVMGLILIASSRRKLLIAVTSFTLAHSITLISGMLGLIGVAVSFVEAMIALSIIFLAREIVLNNKTTLTYNHLEIITFIFGLLHGFGFATSLKDIGLPQDSIGLSLFSFNVGIELGQLIFIFIMLFLIFFIKRLSFFNEVKFKIVTSYFIGIISSYWLIDRIFIF